MSSISALSKIKNNINAKITSQLPIRSLSQEAFQKLRHSNAETTPEFDSEVEHHSRLANEWWNPLAGLIGLHAMNAIRVPFVRDGLLSTGCLNHSLHLTSKVLQGQNILEVGCGGGILTESLARIHANVTGIDLSNDLIKVAKQHLMASSPELSSRITYKMEPVEVHAMNNLEKYDAVVVSEVIEHIDNKTAFLSSCVDTLRPGGSIFITTMNRTPVMWLTGIILAEYVFNMVPKGTHHWDKLISPRDITKILNALNCNTVLLKGCIYDFWSNKWQWVPIDDFSYALHAVKSEKSVYRK